MRLRKEDLSKDSVCTSGQDLPWSGSAWIPFAWFIVDSVLVAIQPASLIQFWFETRYFYFVAPVIRLATGQHYQDTISLTAVKAVKPCCEAAPACFRAAIQPHLEVTEKTRTADTKTQTDTPE